MTQKIFNSFGEIAMANGAAPSPYFTNSVMAASSTTENGIAEAVQAAKSMEDFNEMYQGAMDAARASLYGEYSAGAGVMESEFAAGAQKGIVSGVSDVADELKDADEKKEFVPTESPDFTKKMKSVYKANDVVQQGVGLLSDAVREKLVAEPVPAKVRQDAAVVRGYADTAIKQRPSRFSEEGQKKEGLKHVQRMVGKQRALTD